MNLQSKRDIGFLIGTVGMIGSSILLGFAVAKMFLIDIIAGLGMLFMFTLGNLSIYGELREKILEFNNNKDGECR